MFNEFIQRKSELFICLLYLIREVDPNSYLQGRTKLQKCVYLLQNFLELTKNNQFEYKAGKFGPFSPELRTEVEYESVAGTITIIENDKLNIYDDEITTNNTRYDHKLTELHLNMIKEIFTSYPPDIKLLFYAVRNLSFYDAELIIGLIYNLFPKMTINSKILPKIKGIPAHLIKKTAISFFRSLPYRLVKKIYDSNEYLRRILDITEITQYKKIKNDKEEENKIISKIINENMDLLKGIAEN